MKLDVKAFRYLSPEDWRVLTAFEMGSKNHEVVPTPLATQLSGLHNGSGGVGRSISTLAKAGLIAKVKNARYDGYRLTFGGYDYLALHAHTKANAVLQLGSTMGVGKESDIWLVTSPSPLSGAPLQSILKIHRLGRTSFRTASTKRSYQGRREHCSWQFLSRLSAQKEYQAMNMLRDAGFRTPRPIAWNRHTIVMSLVPGMPLRQVPLSAFGKGKREREKGVTALYGELLELIMQLAGLGLIHGDINEFNVLIEGVREEEEEGDDQAAEAPEIDDAADPDGAPLLTPHLIDFPQITSMSHPQAEEFFDRDVRGIKDFFRKRYHFESADEGPHFSDAMARLKKAADKGDRRLDVEMEAAGYDRKASRHLDAYFHAGGGNGNSQQAAGDESSEDDGEVDLLSPGEEEMLQATEESSFMMPVQEAKGLEDLLQGLDELQMPHDTRPAAGKTQPKTKAAAGWSI